jgi:SAM-dependent methyltransferase
MPPNFAAYYDAVIPWQNRLAREMPLLEKLARGAGSRVLVPACGTGGHVVALAQRGFQVLGFDADEAAAEFTRRRIEAAAGSIAGAGGGATVVLLRMQEAQRWGPIYDAAFCLGNALPGLSAPGELLHALQGIAAALRPDGVFLTQNLNFDLRWKQRAHWFPLLSGETANEEVLLVKFADYEAEFINFHPMFLVREKPQGLWQAHIRSTKWLPLFRDRLADLLREAGFGDLRFWGDYNQSPFDAEKSNDLLVAAEKI